MSKGINISIALKRSRIFIFAIMIHFIFAISPNHSLADMKQAFIWDSVNGMQDLGTPGVSYSTAHGINNSGQVVGSFDTPDGTRYAFIWDHVNGMQDLGSPEVSYSAAYDINDSGEVVGIASIPLPGAVWLLGSGLFGILLCVNSRKKMPASWASGSEGALNAHKKLPAVPASGSPAALVKKIAPNSSYATFGPCSSI